MENMTGGKRMANQEQLDILKQGVQVWNEWRVEKLDVQIDLSKADLNYADLTSANFSYANLSGTILIGAILNDASLVRANLRGAILRDALFFDATLDGADLTSADLVGADLQGTDFNGANLKNADLVNATLNGATLNGADLNGANFLSTVFGDVDLSTEKGLETVRHFGPSTIGIDTIIRSQGKIPEIFLRGAGVPSSIIEQIPALIGSLKPIDYYSCFISYSSNDVTFAKQLLGDLRNNRVRCWLDLEDMNIGDRIRDRIDQTIPQYDKLLLILSEQSLMSEWVEDEVETDDAFSCSSG